MNIFILEDNLERIEKFKLLFKNHNIVFSCDINESIEYLYGQDYHVICLDHDLGHNTLTSENNGYELVKKIIELNLQKKSIFYIHSTNMCGANNMVNLLKNNGYNAEWYPFDLIIIR